jgi:glutathione S-transferase
MMSLQEFGYILSEYPNLDKWFARVQSLPSFEENKSGAEALANIMKSLSDEPAY